MNGDQHRLFAATAWITATGSVQAEASVMVLGLVPAMVFSAGRLSPDMDVYNGWARMLTLFPGKVDNVVLGHRRTTHWWGWPAAFGVWAHLAQPIEAMWLIWAALLGWFSHLVGDFIFGKGGGAIRKGIPLAPWWAHVGIGLKSGGPANTVFVVVMAALLIFAGTRSQTWAPSAFVMALVLLYCWPPGRRLVKSLA